MYDIPDATNAVTFYNDYQFNSLKNNVIDSVESTGQTPAVDPLTPGTPDPNTQQLSIGMAIHAAGGDFYVDSGAADAYVLGVQTISGTAMRAPNVYFNGMRCRFVSGNTNTGASTVNVATLGLKTIKKDQWSNDLVAGDIVSGKVYELIYDTSSGFFELVAVEAISQVPVGSYLDMATELVPTGFLECDGSAISRTTYSDLFAVVSDQYGVGNGTTTFNIPDWRGLFARCWDNGASIDPDAGSISGQSANTNSSTSVTNAPNVSGYAERRFVGADITGTDIPANTKIVSWVGTTITISKAATGTSAIADMAIDFDVVESQQANDTESHTHDFDASPADTGSPSDKAESTSSGADLITVTTDSTGGNETRPINMYQMRCIKY